MSDFNFAFVVATCLIASLIGTHYYFKDKIKNYYECKKNEYSNRVAQDSVDGIKEIDELRSRPSPPYDEMKTIYTEMYKKQFNGVDDLLEASRLEDYLNNTMFFFFVAIALFLFTGIFPYINILNYSFSVFSIPSMISGVISVIIACYRIYKIGKII